MAKFAEVQTLEVGDFKITFLPDGGGLVVPTATYPASSEAGWAKYEDFLDEEGRLVVTIGGFLIETGEHKIVMDLGVGPQTVDFPGFGPFIGGKYLESWEKTGVERGEVTAVVYTHLHLDHVGWTTVEVDGQREFTFPNARHLCTKVDWEFWLDDESGLGPNPETVQEPLKEKIEFIEAGDELAPGITVLATPGHTPGHISLRLDAGDKQVYLIADLLHSEVQFYEADWFVAFDVDPETARETREKMYETVAQPNIIVGDGHFADAVFGQLKREGDGWRWQALPTD
ncbi:MAG TPA: MBL fold metallo-hydrolase [Anaerolineae bacterium]|nr:MBL fold metallo-hydrolase [Anaerolineae bacterium]